MTIILMACGTATGMVVGWDQTSEVCTRHAQEIQDALPSHTVSCIGKPTPCVESINGEGEVICAVWVERELVKVYCNPTQLRQLVPETGLQKLESATT